MKKKKLWKRSRTVRDNLRKSLPKMAAEYFDAGRLALAPGKTWEEMHQFRLATKRFRYMLEIFRPAYGPALDLRIESLRHVQTLLGDVNDCIVTSAMVETLPTAGDLKDKLAVRAAEKTQKLRTYWTTRFDAQGHREQWTRYLLGWACRTAPARRPRTVPAPAVSASE